MTDWTDLRFAVVDVEGNGQQPPDAVELGIVPIVGGEIGEPQTWMMLPDQPITTFVQRIHGISNKDVADKPVFATIRDEVLQALDADVLVAHNAHVDVGVLQRKLGAWECPEVMDTYQITKRLWPGLQDGYKLGVLANYFSLTKDLPPELTPHRAEYDILVCARLFVHIATRHTLDELRNQPAKGSGDETATLF